MHAQFFSIEEKQRRFSALVVEALASYLETLGEPQNDVHRRDKPTMNLRHWVGEAASKQFSACDLILPKSAAGTELSTKRAVLWRRTFRLVPVLPT
ncbi:hypothetical protein AVEN_239206-1 [Araneus ventricosus]|uniref:Uncharacterized protein n=1 Tax=Araneus ventricosus TaxID=182803 RepID=A0A4Y2VW58_ARAVE|nr:hypothetical protein AVEN_10916-1 [Araneus ventricosus]GBO29795.1 hypothetical protein AVEN_73011-1 [Araneus ventricosus]GBO29823.1 hypothetical protein AVEN_239206-1 [Araneus ventricosus]